MKLQNLTVIFIIIILPIILLVSFYISTGLKTINYQAQYDTALLTATHDAIYAFEINTAKDEYSDNAEAKRDILKSSVKMFEKSLCNGCNISTYETSEVEKYIPALVFGMYDGFYMYAPSYVASTGKYEHNLKNYVYYSESFDDGTVIIYSLDNYVVVSGDFGLKEGYLIVEDNWKDYVYEADPDAKAYLSDSTEFTDWFLNTEKIPEKTGASYLDINADNNPEDPNSAFVQHKKTVIKEKIESVLNSSITVYSERTLGYNYKMPKLSEEDWEKVYNNISMISFFQGKSIGFTTYNGYCVLNSTNSNEYVNPNLMYFIDGNYYHDIRCSELTELSEYSKGYKIGDFQKQIHKRKKEDGSEYEEYTYKHDELACYQCINGQLDTSVSVYKYIIDTDNDSIKKSYWTSLARERYNQTKLIGGVELKGVTEMNIEINWYDEYNGTPNYNGFRPNELNVAIKRNGKDFMTVKISENTKKAELIKENEVFKTVELKIDEDNKKWSIYIDELDAYENNAQVIHEIIGSGISSEDDNFIYYNVDVPKEIGENNTVTINCTHTLAYVVNKDIIIKWTDDNENKNEIRPTDGVKVKLKSSYTDKVGTTQNIEEEEVIEYRNTDIWEKENIKLRNYKDGKLLEWTEELELSDNYEYEKNIEENIEENTITIVFDVKCIHESWNDGDKEDPTCTKNGKQEKICSHCGKKVEEVRLALGHSYPPDYEIWGIPTCESSGYEGRYCQNCGHQDGRDIPATGHDYTIYSPIAPTCTSDGVERYYCSHNCGNYEDRNNIPATGGHSYGDWEVKQEAGCESDGRKERVCSNCGDVDIFISYATGHSWSHITIMSPTCESNGEEGEQCDNCGELQNVQFMPSLGHDWDWEYHPAGYGNEYCRRCYLNYKGWQ